MLHSITTGFSLRSTASIHPLSPLFEVNQSSTLSEQKPISQPSSPPTQLVKASTSPLPSSAPMPPQQPESTPHQSTLDTQSPPLYGNRTKRSNKPNDTDVEVSWQHLCRECHGTGEYRTDEEADRGDGDRAHRNIRDKPEYELYAQGDESVYQYHSLFAVSSGGEAKDQSTGRDAKPESRGHVRHCKRGSVADLLTRVNHVLRELGW